MIILLNPIDSKFSELNYYSLLEPENDFSWYFCEC